MSMLNKIKGKPPKDGAEGAGSGASGNSNGVRTATRNGGGAGTSGSGSTGGSGSNPGGPGAAGAGTSAGNSGSTGGGAGTGSSGSSTGGVRSGLANVGRGLKIKGVDGIKSAGIGLLKAPGAVLGATVGLAATVASGGEKAAAFIGGGAAAGSAMSSNLVKNIGKLGKDTYKDYQQGKFGVEAYNNKQFDKQFYKSDGYKMIAEDPVIQGMGINVKEATQQFLDNGITDASKIREALQNGITGDTYKAYEKAEGLAAKDIPTLANAGIGASEYNMLKGAGVKDASKMEEIVRNHGGNAKIVARNAAIASQAKALGITSKNKFEQYVKSYGGLSPEDAEELYNQMSSFWS